MLTALGSSIHLQPRATFTSWGMDGCNGKDSHVYNVKSIHFTWQLKAVVLYDCTVAESTDNIELYSSNTNDLEWQAQHEVSMFFHFFRHLCVIIEQNNECVCAALMLRWIFESKTDNNSNSNMAWMWHEHTECTFVLRSCNRSSIRMFRYLVVPVWASMQASSGVILCQLTEQHLSGVTL